MKKTIIYILLFAAIGIVIYFLFALIQADKTDNTQRPAVQYKTDTLVKIEYVDRVEYRDNFIYKTVFKNVAPDYVQGEKINDTTFINSIKYKDMILTLRKGRKYIEVFGWNENDSLLKKYRFDNVGTEFNVWADSGAVRVDEKRLTWKGIDAVVRGSWVITKWETGSKFPTMVFDAAFTGLKSGIDIYDRVGINVGTYYDFKRKDYLFETELTYKLY